MSEKNGEENMKMEEELELALQRVVNEKQYKYIPQLEHVLTLAQQKERILATQILADKELHCPLVSEGEADEGDEEHLRIDGMEKALLNHKIVKTTLQSAAFSMQIGETVKDIMQQTDVEETVDQFPERGVLLSHSSNNLHTCKELASVMEQKNNHEKEILELQTKYLSHLTVLREKWESLQDRVKQREGETSTHGNLQKKMKEREDKIQLLITMIQGLITSSSFQWGASNYYLQVMLLCDAVTRKLDTVKQKEIMKEISMIHEEREDKENKICGWILTCVAVGAVPIGFLHALYRSPETTFAKRLRGLFEPKESWGPKRLNDRLQWEKLIRT